MRHSPPAEHMTWLGQLVSLSFMLIVLYLFGHQVMTAAKLIANAMPLPSHATPHHIHLHVHRPWIKLDVKI